MLSTAKIGIEKVIPALQRSSYGTVTAIASRSAERARKAANALGIRRAYGSYEELLTDPEIDAIYNPLPNHLHVPRSIQALEAGKHVLCEKPLGLDTADAERLLAASRAHPELKVMEAFMYRFHPQWQLVRELIADGKIGDLRTIQSSFLYFNDNPADIRNQPEIGGGGLLDIGCYSISLARFLFAAEPVRVLATIDIDAGLGIDRLTSGLLDFGDGTSLFTCSTQAEHHQHALVFGSRGKIEIGTPFTPAPDQICTVRHTSGGVTEELTAGPLDQYTAQGDLFARAVLDRTEVPTPLTDAIANMRVIDALKESAARGGWVRLTEGGG